VPPPAVPDAFTIAGDPPELLTPGTSAPLDLSLTNRESFDIAISDLTATVASVSAPRSDPSHPCGVADFSAKGFSGPAGFTLPASSTVSLGELGFASSEWPRIAMLERSTNQDGCKQASLSLSFSGSATEAMP
jgi:hypothetical protein